MALLLERLIRLASAAPSTPSRRKMSRLPGRKEWKAIHCGHEGPGTGADSISTIVLDELLLDELLLDELLLDELLLDELLLDVLQTGSTSP